MTFEEVESQIAAVVDELKLAFRWDGQHPEERASSCLPPLRKTKPRALLTWIQAKRVIDRKPKFRIRNSIWLQALHRLEDLEEYSGFSRKPRKVAR